MFRFEVYKISLGKALIFKVAPQLGLLPHPTK
jgi:hypothetical protein